MYRRYEHTLECRAHRDQAYVALTSWNLDWPLSCFICHGTGTSITAEGELLFCKGCTLDDRCPRCRSYMPVDHTTWPDADEQVPCPDCGWSWGRGELDAMPGLPWCICSFEHAQILE